MKKLLATVLSVFLLVSLLSVMSLATTVPFEDDYVGENDIVLAGLNGVSPFIGNLANVLTLEDTCYWLSDYADKYNIKYVSFNGNLTSGANYRYRDVITLGGKTISDLLALTAIDKEWIKEFNALKSTASILTDVELPYGVSLALKDYCSDGLDRLNLLANEFTTNDFTGGSPNITIESFDTNTFALIVEQNKTKYIIYQLEAFPRKDVINWFNTTNAAHGDKRAFVFTTSFVDKNGDMYTQFDPTIYKRSTAPDKGNSTLITNMVNIGAPFDGNQIWNHALSKFDNIVMVMSANAEPGKNIVTSKFKNANGYDTISVLSNLINGYGSAGLAYPVLIKFSEENKTLDLRYAVPYDNNVGGYIEESRVTIKLDNLADLPEPDPVTLLPKAAAQTNGENKAYINGYEGNLFKPNANMTKAEASTIFARLLAGTQTLPKGNTTKFIDVDGHWAYDAIAYLDANGFYFTNNSDKYYPDMFITRAEFVELAYFASNLAATESIKFNDVPETHKYYDAIIAGAAAGLVNGYADGSFKPDATITRAEVVTVINRMLSLLATKDTVSKEHLDNIFNDIEGHWAEYQILLASNDNVHGNSFYSIDSSIFTETSSLISFENKHIKVTLNKKNGKVDKVIYLPTGENVLAASSTPWFAFANTPTGATLEPTKLELVDGRLKFTFKGGFVAYFIIDVKDNYFTVELDSNISKAIAKLTYGNIDFNYTPSETPGTFRASNILMDTRSDQLAVPGGYTSLVGAYTRTDIGFDTMGVKFAIAFSKMEEHRDILKEIVLAIDPSKGITSDHGGPFTHDESNKDIFYDYVIISNDININNAAETAKLAKDHSIDQIDIHHAASTFIQGDFNFTSAATDEELNQGTFITASVFKERIADKMHAEGVQIGLHTYSSLIFPRATTILSDPKWQQQLQFNPTTYTLRGELSKTKTSVKTYEDASVFEADGRLNLKYILIDQEIILVQQGTTSGFLNCKRAQLGTSAQRHSDGAVIRQLQGYYGGIQSQPGSELFWHIADLTAKAYNEGGFDMIYLDGLESFQYFVPKEHQWYYYAEFYRRVISQCIKKPIIEDSAGITVNWVARGRGGAVDSATKAFKSQVKGHLQLNERFTQRYYTANLGWFQFDPDGVEEYKNTISKTIFHDDLDFMGSIAIANDFPNVDNDFSISIYNAPTRHSDNVMYYSVYSKLRKGGYFSEEVKEQIRNGKYEYKVFKQDDGTWAFREMSYSYNRVYDMTDKLFITGNANNPFDAQTPFIRIEQRYSTLSENEIMVLALDETKEVSELTGKKAIAEVDLSERYAMKVKVYGNGSSTGGVMISITSSTAYNAGRTDYYIPTSHTGWREFILIDADNADHPGVQFSNINYTGVNYDTYRFNPPRSNINQVEIGIAGDTTGVKIDDIKAYAAVDAPAKNPSVTIGGSTITFNTEVHSGEFIEFYPETGKAYLNYYTSIYDNNGKWKSSEAHTKEITYTGNVSVPSGKFSYTYDAESTTGATLRAQIKIGVSGEVIANPADWVAPEIDMGDATLDIIIR